MKGIMRKRLVALLSLAGFAGSTTPVTAQVLKGSDQADTKKESTVKDAKATQENKDAANTAIQDKRKNAVAESNAAKDAKTIKMRKAGGEQKAAQEVVSEKVGSDQKARKAGGTQEDANAKFNKTTAEANGVKKTTEYKPRKAGGEQLPASTNGNGKRDKVQAESNASQGQATIKMRKAGGEPDAASNQAAFKDHGRGVNASMGDGSVKPGAQATIGSATGGAGAGKAKFNDIHVKGGKSAAETNAATGDHIKKGKNNAAEGQAAQQDANKKGVKQADQPK